MAVTVYERAVCGIEEAAAYLGVSAKTIRRRITKGRYVPGLMPRHGQEPFEFSKSVLREHVNGAYTRLRVVTRRQA